MMLYKYMDLCKRKAEIKTSMVGTDIICVFDGFVVVSMHGTACFFFGFARIRRHPMFFLKFWALKPRLICAYLRVN